MEDLALNELIVIYPIEREYALGDRARAVSLSHTTRLFD
jgi:hypothetical protein